MSKFFDEPIDAFDLVVRDEPTVSFCSSIKAVDNLLNGKLRSGEIVEICGERSTAKLTVVRAIVSNALLAHKDCESFRILVFDHAKQFNIAKLKDSIARKKPDLTSEEIDQLLGSVFVQDFIGTEQLHFVLRRLCEIVNEENVWRCYQNELDTTNTLIFIMDIGSLMHSTSSGGMKGQMIQDEIHRCLQHLADGGAFILMLNHAFNTNNDKFPVASALGYNWRNLIKNRLYLMRDEQDPQLHIALVKDENGKKRQKRFRINVRPSVKQDGS